MTTIRTLRGVAPARIFGPVVAGQGSAEGMQPLMLIELVVRRRSGWVLMKIENQDDLSPNQGASSASVCRMAPRCVIYCFS
ncbi:MAG: hypothetical protein LJE70_05610 [Chromatiaceae bacterium]|jgi:hypothetical protein|nr:hypothetical protein [Chromatiaceae bacterium]